jgi:O-phospho-L-seryl-tRNASec:L-selenocysteinyl-tRNA synthase
MSLALCIQAVRKLRIGAKYVIWSRIDQKSCFKCISAAGLTPLVVENVLDGDSIVTNVEAIESLIIEHGDEIACVLTTTSCFAPRCPDVVDAVAVLCEKYGVPHVINNAYGLQCNRICKLINRAVAVNGRIDYIVQSTDKNLMVPVGGAIIASPMKDRIAHVSKLYAGRASSTPIVDVFITLMSMGESGLRNLINRRLSLIPRVIDAVNGVVKEFGEGVLLVPNNTISFGISLANLGVGDPKKVTYFGSMLFHRCVSGSRVVSPVSVSSIDGHRFDGWGAHIAAYPTPYLTVACTIGLSEAEVEEFCRRLRRVFVEYYKHQKDSDVSSAIVSASSGQSEGSPMSSHWVSKYNFATFK